MAVVSIDQTWHVGQFYLDVCGLIPSNPLRLGIDIEWNGDTCWGRRVSLHIVWVCLTFGLEVQR